MKNTDNSEIVTQMNKHICMIAQSEQCEFEDISKPRVWNPKATKSAMSFASAMGLSSKIRNYKSLYDLTKIFFCLDVVPAN